MMLSHDRRGSGPALLLIHGIGSFWPAWEVVLDRVAAEREVIAIDLPGFGGSPVLDGSPTVHALADAVHAFATEALGLARYHVAGNSLGGWIALELARAGRVDSACALSPAGFWSPRELAYTRAVLAFGRKTAQRVRGVAPRLLQSSAGRAALLSTYVARPAQMSPEAALAGMRNLADSPGFEATLEHAITGEFGPPLDDPSCPITIAWGSRDALLFPWQAGRAKGLVPRARHLTLGGLGHVPMTDDPAVVATVLLTASDD